MTASMGIALAAEVLLPGHTLVLAPEARYVTETATGLVFADDTPLDLVGALIERLTRQHKRIEWAIGDALNFAERRYGDTYAQWADETGLSENTLATIKWVAGKIEPSRRREDVGWSHHREVAGIDDSRAQDCLLDEAADKGMTRWELRQAVKAEQEKQRGHAVTSEGEPLDATPAPLSQDDLTDEARAVLNGKLAGVGKRHAVGFAAGWVQALAWADQADCFTREIPI